MIELPPDFREFLQLANSAGIEYLVIGGYAVGYYGAPRATGDLDVWVAAHEANADRLVEVLKAFGFDGPELTRELFLEAGNVIRMGVPPMRLEILTQIDGVSFSTCYERRVVEDLHGLEVPFIARSDLLANKTASGRTKDLADCEALTDDRDR